LKAFWSLTQKSTFFPPSLLVLSDLHI
jgi:hypothetical protein